ncbi:MAG: ATP-binding protein [Acetobacteraceae bacterium]|nr:ATP-binding protein [Acetobacteraceae bacterium]
MALDRFWSNGPLGVIARHAGSADAAADFAVRARRHTTRLSIKVAMLALGLAIVMWVVITLVGRHEQDAALASARIEGSNLTAALADEVEQTLTTVDRAMAMLADEARDDPAHLDLYQIRTQLAVLGRPIVQGALIDAEGKLRASTLLNRTEPIDFSDREHFRVHLDGKQHGLFISKPVVGRVSRRVTIQLSRRVEKADGTFLGVVVFSLLPEALTTMYRHLDLGEHGVVSLIGLDGILRARFHPGESTAAETTEGPAIWRPDLAPSEAITFVRRSQIDQVPRLVTLRRLASYPLLVAVGLGLDDVLAVSHTQTWLVRGTGVALTILLGGLTGLLVRELWRRTYREIELAAEQARLQAANAAVSAERVKLAAANLELQASSERAEAANRAKSRFLAQMSHELRTPLHAIIGFAEIIKDQRTRPQPGAPLSDYATQIWTAGRSLLETINAILDIARLDAGTAQLAETTVRIADVVRTGIAAVRSHAQARQIALETDLARDLPALRADAAKLRQILVCLLGNAVRFSPPGGDVVVSAHADPDDGVILAITDSGIGMSDAEIAVALEPFGQVEGVLSRSAGGTGLGLPLAKRLAELHGGSLRIRSTVGSGTTVEVLIPPRRVIRQPAVADEAPGAVA